MITLNNITKKFNNNVVLSDFTFTIEDGRFYTIVGPNGCGKSTLLNILAGTLEKNSGDITSSIHDLCIGYVWQDYRSSLFPWLSISENISFPLKIQGISSKERKRAVQNLIKDFGFEIDLKMKTYNLSGGQQQLINIFRALIVEPDLLLLDEPFSALDQYKSWHIGFELEKMWLKQKNSVFLVSHNVDEAILLADEIILINNQGCIEKTITNYMPRSRTKEMMTEPEHINCKKEIVEFMFEQNRK